MIGDLNLEERLRVGRAQLLGRIRRRRALTRAAIAGGAIFIASSGVAASLAIAQVNQRETATSVECYAHADLNALHSTSGMAAANGGTVDPLPLSAKRQLCALVWKSGLKEAAANGGHWPNVNPNNSTLTVPPLAFCFAPNGMTAGFPIEPPSTSSAQVCDRLGLRAASS